MKNTCKLEANVGVYESCFGIVVFLCSLPQPLFKVDQSPSGLLLMLMYWPSTHMVHHVLGLFQFLQVLRHLTLDAFNHTCFDQQNTLNSVCLMGLISGQVLAEEDNRGAKGIQFVLFILEVYM